MSCTKKKKIQILWLTPVNKLICIICIQQLINHCKKTFIYLLHHTTSAAEENKFETSYLLINS